MDINFSLSSNSGLQVIQAVKETKALSIEEQSERLFMMKDSGSFNDLTIIHNSDEIV